MKRHKNSADEHHKKNQKVNIGRRGRSQGWEEDSQEDENPHTEIHAEKENWRVSGDINLYVHDHLHDVLQPVVKLVHPLEFVYFTITPVEYCVDKLSFSPFQVYVKCREHMDMPFLLLRFSECSDGSYTGNMVAARISAELYGNEVVKENIVLYYFIREKMQPEGKPLVCLKGNEWFIYSLK